MSREPDFISPVSIDLGAKNTGVYFAHYPAGSSIEGIEKEGRVYQLDKDSYTLLMTNRTASRHQRRGYDRRQMVKRLFKLIWEQHFGLEWDKNVQQATSFLFNRRGFSFLTEEYDAEVLRQFPREAYDLLPDELKCDVSGENGEYDFATQIQEWAREGTDRVKEVFDEINKEPERVKDRLDFIKKTDKLKKYCKARRKDKEIPIETKTARDKLSRLPRWIWDEWQKAGVQGLDENFIAGSEIKWKNSDSFDLVTYLNEQSADTACQISDSLPDTSDEENELQSSEWNFRVKDFGLEDEDFTPLEKPKKGATEEESEDYLKWKRRHLHHLAFALDKTHKELQSGARHRKKYFEEIREVLRGKNHSHGYLREFCGKLKRGHFKPWTNEDLTDETLANLIGHLSNLELKPLRKYFNDEGHKNGDYWEKKRLEEIFERWILREWRINPEKDKDKVKGGDGNYNKLRNGWNTREGGVVNFWLNTDPVFTIPPYQDNNNRRPPRCQSLILNPSYLDKNYPKWEKEWLAELGKLECVEEHLGGFEKKLGDLKSGKDKPYFSNKVPANPKMASGRRTLKDLDARVLQFIFDRTKDDDPLNLNEIYSRTKKYRQEQSEEAKKELEKAIKASELPKVLKICPNYKNDAVFKQGSFLHLVCKYYKIRQKARDGRIFIHPEYRYIKGQGYQNTGRFDDNDLLTYCNHKPRQKRYQMLYDLAGLLQVAPTELNGFVKSQNGSTTDERLFNWLNGIDTSKMKTNCDRAAKEQKKRRGRLKSDVQRVHGFIHHESERQGLSLSENVKEILSKSKVEGAYELYKFCEIAKDLCLKVTVLLYDPSKQDEWKQKLCKNPEKAVYLLAQINNLVFKERSGNAGTCAVCSADNAQRMQTITSKNINEAHAKASRLPAIATRLIDGAVMRMARIVGGAIAEDKWKKIKSELKAGKRVRVPIITESNRFEFEPSLKEIKGKSLTSKDKTDREKGRGRLAANKNDRIKEASLSVCPYTGDQLGDAGDLDHIIPRSSGCTLNDEANLIWASDIGNKEIKGDGEFSLEQLAEQYKNKQFDTVNNDEIEKWIIEQIVDAEGENFSFGPYRSFINLTPDQQKAFRHALFLVGHDLREKVIKAIIDNRTRTFVNGTQRYFAQVLADSLYKKARAIKKQHLLTFDYFGVEAQDNTRGNGIHNLRENYEKTDDEVFNYAKQEGEKQQAYSHLIDAQLAFAMVADAHKNDGGLKLKIQDYYSLWPVDTDTGEILEKTIFDTIRVTPQEMRKETRLSRRKFYTVETHHREMIARNNKPSINYQIHRDSLFKENFFPLLRFKNEAIKKGFHQDNSVDFSAKKFSLLLEKDFIHQTSQNDQYEVWNIRKKACQQFLMKIGAVGANQQEIKIAKIIDNLTYQTIKKPIEKVLDTSKKNKPPKTVGEALARWNDCVKKEDFKKYGILLPVYSEWLKFQSLLEEKDKETDFYDFVKNCSLFANNQSKDSHNKVRKVFSLPVKRGGVGNIRLQRKSWDKTPTIQVVAEESFAKYGYDDKDDKDRPHTVLSTNSVPIGHYAGIPHSLKPKPLQWKSIPTERVQLSDDVEIEIKTAEIKSKDADRCLVRLTVSSIKNLSVPQDKPHWKGKIICHDDEDKQGNHHCLSSGWRWFKSPPFELPEDCREVEVEKTPKGYRITFQVVAEESLAKYGCDDEEKPESRQWKAVPLEEVKVSVDEDDNLEIKAAEIIYKDANRCSARLTVSSIKNLSVPQDKPHWKGKIICHDDEDKQGNHHCLSSEWVWFNSPFALPTDRREVKIEKTSDDYVITFTVSKTSRLRNWLSCEGT